MDIESVCIFGGCGFVGRSVAEAAATRGLRVRVEGARATFRSAHVELPRKIAEACRAAGVRHLVHMSALGASRDGPSEYLRSKAEGEESARSAGVACTIFRPSVIFGEHDRFLNFFATLLTYFPVIPLAGARARFQPIWVEDVARAMVAAIGDKRTFGEAYGLCGPSAYTLAELVRAVGEITGHRRPMVGLPEPAAQLQALVLEHLPGKKMTRDNLRSMRVDNVCSAGFPPIFGFQPAPLEAIVPAYLAREGLRDRYDKYRHYAGR